MLKEKCLGFSETAQSLSSARRLTSLALSRHTQLLEILELPQLMDTCVRNGYWEEALELSAHVVRMERKLGYIPLITVFKTVTPRSLVKLDLTLLDWENHWNLEIEIFFEYIDHSFVRT